MNFHLSDGLMTLNWLYLNDKYSVLSGRWKCCKETIGPTVKKHAKMMQSLIKKNIKFVFTHGKRHIASIDCSNFTTNEFCQDSSGQWFDHKSNSSGLVHFTKNSSQECVVGRRPFLKGSRTGEFSRTVLRMEGAQKIEWKCIRWLSKPLL